MQVFLLMDSSSDEIGATVYVFDLDDTLYPEADYIVSGHKHIISSLTSQLKLGDKAAIDALLNNVDPLTCQPLQKIIQNFDLNEAILESLIWMYRLHTPNIELPVETRYVIETLRNNGHDLAIITDGRSISQRKKINALGLFDIPAYVSEEYEKGKPSSVMYKALMFDFPNSNYIYVGDNPHKDFLAPKKLGWKTIGVRKYAKQEYLDNLDTFDTIYRPDFWVASLRDLI